MRTTVLLLVAALASGAAGSEEQNAFVAVPQVGVAPLIDGTISEGEWSEAAVTCGFRESFKGLPARGSVVVSVCYDTGALYCLFRCTGEDLAELSGGPAERDSSVWVESEVELFLAPETWPVSRYAHLMVNHANTIADEMCDREGRDLAWNPDWQHATARADGEWIAEMAIPWRALELEAPHVGNAFRCNFARNAASIGELSSWADLLGGFHQPEGFGRLVLVGEAPTVAIAGLPARAIGPTVIEGLLTGREEGVALTVSVSRGTADEEHSHSASFAGIDGERHVARLGFDVPNGARGLVVSAKGPDGELLWRQTVRLDLPDLLARVREVRAGVEVLRAGEPDPRTEVDLFELAGTLAELEARTMAPVTAGQLPGITAAIEDVTRHLGDLNMLEQARQRGGPGGNVLPYCVTNPVCTRKIQPQAVDPGPLAEELRIAMAKNEYEPVQIAVCPIRENLRGVRVSASRLKGPGGAVIPRERVVVTPIGFVNCELSTGGASLAGNVPDVLLPNRAVDVPAGSRQPFFITVQSTADDPPGEYRGTVRITPRNAPTVRLPLVVQVYDVALPAKSHLRTAFVLWGSFGRFMRASGPDAYIDTYIRYSKVMLAHRISPINMWLPEQKPDGTWDLSDTDRYLSAVVPLGLTTFNIGGNGQVAGERNVELATAAAEHLKARGWWDLHYVYGRDEAPGDMLAELQTSYSALVEAVPDIKIMQTGWSPHPELKGLVRVWCPLTAGADIDAAREAQKEGDEVWWYVCCGPTAPYANLFVDYPGIDHRILGWMTYRDGIEGFLYWGVDVWSHNDLPLADYDRTDYANWNPNSFGTINGDGYLLYPGRRDSPVPSMRLALLRDGFEDYDLFTEVEALADGQGPLAERARELLTLDAPLIASLSEYAQDGNDLLRRREAILQVGEQLARQRG